MPLQCARRVTTNFEGVDVVPFLGAIAGAIVVCYGCGEGDDQLWRTGRGASAGCHCRVPLYCASGGEGDNQLWGSGRAAIAGCHCSVLVEGRVTANFGGVDVVPLQGGNFCFISSFVLRVLQTLHCSLH